LNIEPKNIESLNNEVREARRWAQGEELATPAARFRLSSVRRTSKRQSMERGAESLPTVSLKATPLVFPVNFFSDTVGFSGCLL
jgi:hypothetical protein